MLLDVREFDGRINNCQIKQSIAPSAVGFDVPLLTAYTGQASSLRYHFVRFEIPAVMAFRIGANVGFFSAASSEVSRNSIVGKTRETVGTRSEENAC
jgi:hypothetical protein